ncbi:hypothetical protein TNIN_121331 [Trichonephila inaurata madagascariensis]|uniref:Uncharacterized protein n=1 Tax=Trichonephila inaurata madagascariensis TaxID=2747483 RepID=A0A8X6XDL5_9ARAC|nr:hypothetical protein TNIN_121331 [Trichonephila inaurata madagascariensis]
MQRYSCPKAAGRGKPATGNPNGSAKKITLRSSRAKIKKDQRTTIGIWVYFSSERATGRDFLKWSFGKIEVHQSSRPYRENSILGGWSTLRNPKLGKQIWPHTSI